MAISLFEHNQSAYDSAQTMLAQVGKAAIVHPTGTGKSYIAFKLIEDNPAKKFLWLSPSEYIFKTQLENVRRDAPELPVEQVQFYTYAKLAYLTDSELEALGNDQPDYIILDEYHRGGAPQWEKHLRRLLETCPNAKLLGLSATNVRYLDNQRDMAQELFDGYIASELSLGEAIVKKILPAPKYVMALYQYEAELAKYQRKVRNMPAGMQDNTQRILDALKRTLKNADGLEAIFARHIPKRDARLIVFCANQEHMQEMQMESQKWFRKIDPDMHSYAVYSDNPEASTDFENFKADCSDHLKLLFCIDMLNEGIHVADLDGVIMLRPTISPIVYKQQLGRALSAGSNKTPLVFDIVNNFDGLYSVGAIENEMAKVLHFQPNGEGDAFKEVGFTLIDEVREARQLFRQLDAALSSSWDLYFQEAKGYFQENGNLEVPKRYITEEGLSLGIWIQTQRRVYNGSISGILTSAQIASLESIGMVWENRLEQSWNRRYAAAESYYKEYGNLLVPTRYKDKERGCLGSWIANQRTARNAGKLTEEQIARLDKIGMVWNFPDEKWEMYYLEALRYFKEHGNLSVPREYVTASGIRLGAWLGQISRTYAGIQQGAAPLTAEQISRLEAIGMVWGNRNESRWQKSYAQAQFYFNKHGNLNVPLSYVAPDGTKLGKWVTVQRTNRKGGTLSQQRIAMLDELAMDWRLEDPWEYRYSLVQEYKEAHGDLKIPAKYKTPDGIWLGNWLYRQKTMLKKGNVAELTEKQIEKLKNLMVSA